MHELQELNTRLLKVCVIIATSDLTVFKGKKSGCALPFTSQNRRRDLYGFKSTDCEVLSVSFTILITTFFGQKEKEQNNQQQKQPTQETAFNMHYPRNTKKIIKMKKQEEKKANIEF